MKGMLRVMLRHFTTVLVFLSFFFFFVVEREFYLLRVQFFLNLKVLIYLKTKNSVPYNSECLFR